jgi:hypothetical protein
MIRVGRIVEQGEAARERDLPGDRLHRMYQHSIAWRDKDKVLTMAMEVIRRGF